MTDPTTVPAGSGETALTIIVERDRITIVGDIRTAADREQLRVSVSAALETLTPVETELVIDLTRAKYLDTAALTTLLATSRRCLDHGRTLAIEGVGVALYEQLRETHLDQVFQSHRARITAARPAA